MDESSSAFNGLPRELRWNIRGYIAERNFVAKPQDDLLLTQSSHVALLIKSYSPQRVLCTVSIEVTLQDKHKCCIEHAALAIIFCTVS
jgi:hypothetical protein